MGQSVKALDRDLESLSVAEGGVGGQLCSSGDGGSRCEVRNREVPSQRWDPCLPALLRRNLAMMVSSMAAGVAEKGSRAARTAKREREKGSRHCPQLGRGHKWQVAFFGTCHKI